MIAIIKISENWVTLIPIDFTTGSIIGVSMSMVALLIKQDRC